MLLVAILVVAMSGCARTAARTRPTETLELDLKPRDFRRIGYVEGESCVPRFLIFFRFKSPNPVEAARNAMKKTPKANFLANRHVTAEERFVVPLIHHRVCVVIEGVAIKLYDLKGGQP